MNIMAVDDELLALSLLSRAIQAAAPGGETPACFSNVKDAYMYAEQQPVDIAFLDILAP